MRTVRRFGAGKSTVLACVAGVETPDRGQVTSARHTLPAEPRAASPAGRYLTQDADLFPHLRVDENVCFGIAAGSADAWIAELRERLELGGIWRSPAREISGGQARRVALARMLARRPPLVLLDEPFSGLDRHLVRDLLDALTTWQKTLGFTLVVVDHEPEILERLCVRTVVVEEGRVVQDASWQQLRAAPATPLLAELLAPL